MLQQCLNSEQDQSNAIEHYMMVICLIIGKMQTNVAELKVWLEKHQLWQTCNQIIVQTV